jgi:hypothetical protein
MKLWILQGVLAGVGAGLLIGNALLLAGCETGRASINVDHLREKQTIEQTALAPPPDTVVIKSPRPIVRHAEMTEDEAQQVWLRTGVYRGLTDDEWIRLMDDIRWVREQQKDKAR